MAVSPPPRLAPQKQAQLLKNRENWGTPSGHAPSLSRTTFTIHNLVRVEEIAELLKPFLVAAHTDKNLSGARLTASQLEAISIYINLLVRWNAPINLTAVREPREMVTRHFGESLFAGRHIFPAGLGFTGNVVDVGSGAGFPGLPIKMWAPQIRLTLIESNHKKVAFLREVVRALKLSEVAVLSCRAEEFRELADVVTLRAVERFDSALPVAASLVAPRGRLATLIGEAQVQRAKELVPSFHWNEPIGIPMSENRVLMIGESG
jgi:16S rRNA (guanine527-N7)-methyltransferase